MSAFRGVLRAREFDRPRKVDRLPLLSSRGYLTDTRFRSATGIATTRAAALLSAETALSLTITDASRAVSELAAAPSIALGDRRCVAATCAADRVTNPPLTSGASQLRAVPTLRDVMNSAEISSEPVPQSTSEQLERLLGSEVIRARRIRRGYTPTARWVIKLSDGRSAFVKHAVHEAVIARLRREYHTYSYLTGSWLPQVLAFEDGACPILVLEDLSACHWPPPWSPSHVDAVRTTLAAVASHPVPLAIIGIAELL